MTRPHTGGRRRLACVLLLGLTALLGGASRAAAEPALPPGFQDSIAIPGLEEPTNFRFAPNGEVFVAEKPGYILVYENIEDTTPEVFADLRTYVYQTGDRGLLGLALDPKFTEGRPYVYALYTYDHILGDPAPPPKWGTPKTTGDPCPDLNGGDACLVSGRLVRLTAEGNPPHAKLEGGGEPFQEVLAEGWCQQFSSHSIGDLQFGPEGALYVSGGDGASFGSTPDYGELGTEPNPCGDPPGPKGTALTPPSAEGGSLRSQNPDNLDGKILRVDPDTGKGLPDNPLASNPSENAKRVVAEGFRNPFRFTIDQQSGEIYTDNVGSSEIEEIDRFAAPPPTLFNSGWPCFEGPERQFQFKTLGLTICKHLYEEEEEGKQPFAEPFFYYSHRQSVVPEDECPFEYGSALGGISFYEGAEFPPAYKGALFITDTVRGCVYAIFPGADGRPDPSTAIRFMRESRIYPAVDIEEGPGGSLYYADLFGDEEAGLGAIHRITYAPGAPTARLTANPPYGTALPLKITLEAGESSDPESEALEFDWDLDGNGSFETHGGETKTLEFTQKQLEEEEEKHESLNHVVAVRVTDGDGHSSVARVTLYPGDKPPVPTITAPEATYKWGVGDEIKFTGSATDAKGKPIVEPLFYYWSTRILHCPTGPTACHTHPLQVFAGVTHGELTAPEHDYPSYLEITLRVADKRGLSGSKTIKLEPRTVNLAIGTSPPGIELTAGLLQGLSPLSLTAIEGSHVLLSAPATATLGGQAYNWQSWSDGGERIHTVTADSSRSITATYAAQPSPPPPGEGPKPGPPAPSKVTIKSHPPKKGHSGTARFTFASSGSGDSFKCKLDKAGFKACRSPQVYKHLKPGSHTFSVVAIGAAGQSTPAKFSWKVLKPKRSG
jgi:glucose/arabinose dehydrogenase